MKNKYNNMVSKYIKLTDREHALTRPGMYIGNIINEDIETYIINNEKIVNKTINYSPGFYKIFDEILVNAYDHAVRTRNENKKNLVSIIKINVEQETNKISIFNNGQGIDTSFDKNYNEYIPEIIFGNLRTSENFNDDENRITGGLNGLGSKLTNIFSNKFIVEIGNSKTKEKYIQVFEKNLLIKNKPKITKYSKIGDYLEISYYPDLERFKMKNIDDNILNLFHKRALDLCACLKWLNHKVNVYFNENLLTLPKFQDYINLYEIGSETVLTETPNENWDIGVALSQGDFKQISFVNGIFTKNGGKHVNYIVNQIVNKLYDNLLKKHKDLPIKKSFIKNNLFIFVRCNINKPDFNSQTKDELITEEKLFGSICSLSSKFIEKIGLLGVYDKVIEISEFKNDNKLKKNDGKKKNKVLVPKYITAEYSGTNKSTECTLILTEGDSAATMALSGLTSEQRKYYGIFPLKGKLVNVSDISSSKLNDNDEITNLKKIIGLEHKKVYTDLSSLRYGRIMAMCDQDLDGSHIKGLLFNMFNKLWPSLFKFDNFLSSFLTPIIKVSKGNNKISFYSLKDYNKWKTDSSDYNLYKIKYYKGLGTSDKKEAQEYFQNLNTNTLTYTYTKDTNNSFDLAFNKKRADDRKKWLLDFDNSNVISTKKINLDDFINKDLILFSWDDVSRNIPNIMDGLKISQRKVLYSAFKRNLINEIKVSQFSGYVSEHSGYHHGEKSLEDTIIGMANNYMGSNNINLFLPNGQFGSRISTKNNASSRYIHTLLNPLTGILFNENDNKLLKYLDDDGFSIEPEYYVPILPLILINGCRGIGTGFSTFIPNFNPQDIIENIKLLLENKKLKDLSPWYNKFLGSIIKESDNTYTITGNYNLNEKDKILHITELPVGVWTNTYKEFITELFKDDKIKDFTDNSTDEKINFIIKLKEIPKNIILFFKLSTKISLSNLHLFDSKNKIKKYNDINEIQIEFFNKRLITYTERRKYIIDTLTNELLKISEKVRYITLIREDKINMKLEIKIVKEKLKEYKFKKIEDNYDYLLNLPIKLITKEEIERLIKKETKLKKELQEILNKTNKTMYIDDLNELEEELKKKK